MTESELTKVFSVVASEDVIPDRVKILIKLFPKHTELIHFLWELDNTNDPDLI